MGLFTRKKTETLATGAEIDAAGKALARGDSSLADQLCDRVPEHHRQQMAMAILGASADHTPQD